MPLNRSFHDGDEPLHDGTRTFIPNQGTPVTTHTILDAFSRKLSDLNRKELLAGGTADIQLRDPRDIVLHAHALTEGILLAGAVPPMDLVEALGAQVLALALAVARVEDGQPHLGDAA